MSRRELVLRRHGSGWRSFWAFVGLIGLLAWMIGNPIEAAHTVRDVWNGLGDAIDTVKTFVRAAFG